MRGRRESEWGGGGREEKVSKNCAVMGSKLRAGWRRNQISSYKPLASPFYIHSVALTSITFLPSSVLHLSLHLFQVNQNLRSFGTMSRNDVQCMLYNHRDGLPTTISRGLNQKVDQLLKVGMARLGHVTMHASAICDSLYDEHQTWSVALRRVINI